MTEIVLVRHGEPHWEPGGRAVDEPELTALGHEQARRVAKALEAEHFDAVYVSPLRRARETAAPVIEALGVEAIEKDWLAELRLPELQGMTSQQVQVFFSQARARSRRRRSGLRPDALTQHRECRVEDPTYRTVRSPPARHGQAYLPMPSSAVRIERGLRNI